MELFCVQASVMWKQRTVEVSRHKLSSHLTAILASSASMITLSCTDPKDTDYAALASAVSTMCVCAPAASVFNPIHPIGNSLTLYTLLKTA